MNQENQNIQPTQNTQSSTQLPKELWEKKLKENEKTAINGQTKKGDSFLKSLFSTYKGKTAAVPTPQAAEQGAKLNVVPAQEPPVTGNVPPAKTHAGGGFWAFLLLVFFAASVVCGVYVSVKPSAMHTSDKGSVNKNHSLNLGGAFASSKEGPGIAWIKVRGVITEDNNSSPFSLPSSASAIAKRIRQAAKADNVKAIVLDINSPGGTVASVQNLYSEINKARKNGKKVVALFRDVAASGGFYIAMAADKIVAEPGTITGSVGVIMQTSNVQGLLGKIGVTVTPVTSGKYKDIGSMFRPMSDAEKAILQDMVSDTYGQFKAAVAAGRPNVAPEKITEYTDGRVFTGQRAYDVGFIDLLGGEEEARLLAGELAGLKDPKILSPKGENLKDFLYSFGSAVESSTLTKQLESITTPSVSYLWMN